jgi:hypothetical protein
LEATAIKHLKLCHREIYLDYFGNPAEKNFDFAGPGTRDVNDSFVGFESSKRLVLHRLHHSFAEIRQEKRPQTLALSYTHLVTILRPAFGREPQYRPRLPLRLSVSQSES